MITEISSRYPKYPQIILGGTGRGQQKKSVKIFPEGSELVLDELEKLSKEKFSPEVINVHFVNNFALTRRRSGQWLSGGAEKSESVTLVIFAPKEAAIKETKKADSVAGIGQEFKEIIVTIKQDGYILIRNGNLFTLLKNEKGTLIQSPVEAKLLQQAKKILLGK